MTMAMILKAHKRFAIKSKLHEKFWCLGNLRKTYVKCNAFRKKFAFVYWDR